VLRRSISDGSVFGGGSKANRLRTFRRIEPNHVIAKLTQAMIEYDPTQGFTDDDNGVLREECRKVASRLEQGTPARN
jgi:hypothetical protein